MLKRLVPALLLGAVALFSLDRGATQARAGDAPLPRFNYYPYYYWPANYWPTQGPKWPEPQGAPYMRPPAYQAFPPFQESRWRYELWQPQRYYRGSHFWLDQF